MAKKPHSTKVKNAAVPASPAKVHDNHSAVKVSPQHDRVHTRDHEHNT